MRRDESYWRKRIDRPGEPSIPILLKNMHRFFWVPRRYRELCALVLDGARWTVRRLAARLGYSPSGLYHALESLHGMGIARTIAIRGRHGSIRVLVSGDAQVMTPSPRNVPPTTGGTSRYLLIYGSERENDVLWGVHLQMGPAS